MWVKHNLLISVSINQGHFSFHRNSLDTNILKFTRTEQKSRKFFKLSRLRRRRAKVGMSKWNIQFHFFFPHPKWMVSSSSSSTHRFQTCNVLHDERRIARRSRRTDRQQAKCLLQVITFQLQGNAMFGIIILNDNSHRLRRKTHKHRSQCWEIWRNWKQMRARFDRTKERDGEKMWKSIICHLFVCSYTWSA